MSARIYTKVPGGTFYGWFFDTRGKAVYLCLKTKDRRAAELALRRLEREAHATPGLSKDAPTRTVKDALEYLLAGELVEGSRAGIAHAA